MIAEVTKLEGGRKLILKSSRLNSRGYVFFRYLELEHPTESPVKTVLLLMKIDSKWWKAVLVLFL